MPSSITRPQTRIGEAPNGNSPYRYYRISFSSSMTFSAISFGMPFFTAIFTMSSSYIFIHLQKSLDDLWDQSENNAFHYPSHGFTSFVMVRGRGLEPHDTLPTLFIRRLGYNQVAGSPPNGRDGQNRTDPQRFGVSVAFLGTFAPMSISSLPPIEPVVWS